MGKSRLVFKLTEGDSIVRASIQVSHKTHPDAKRIGFGDEQGLSWIDLSVSKFTLSTWADTVRVYERLAQDAEGRFNIENFQPTALKSSTAFGDFYQDAQGIICQAHHGKVVYRAPHKAKSMLRTVLFINGSPLMLEDIKWNPDGSIKSGYVVNGEWKLTITNGIMYAAGSRIKTITALELVGVESYLSDYNVVIDKAKQKRKAALSEAR